MEAFREGAESRWRKDALEDDRIDSASLFLRDAGSFCIRRNGNGDGDGDWDEEASSWGLRDVFDAGVSRLIEVGASRGSFGPVDGTENPSRLDDLRSTGVSCVSRRRGLLRRKWNNFISNNICLAEDGTLPRVSSRNGAPVDQRESELSLIFLPCGGNTDPSESRRTTFNVLIARMRLNLRYYVYLNLHFRDRGNPRPMIYSGALEIFSKAVQPCIAKKRLEEKTRDTRSEGRGLPGGSSIEKKGKDPILSSRSIAAWNNEWFEARVRREGAVPAGRKNGSKAAGPRNLDRESIQRRRIEFPTVAASSIFNNF